MQTPTEGSATPALSTDATPVRGRAWLLFLLVLLNLFNYIDRYNLPPVLKSVESEFGASGRQLGFLATGFLIVYMITAPVFGWLADRYSRWALVGVGMLIQSLGTFGSGFSSSFTMLLIMRCVVGVGDAAYGPAAPTIISDLYPIEKRGRRLAWFYAAIPVGSALGFAIGGFMQSLTSTWRWGFYSIVPPMLLLGVISILIKDRRVNSAGVKIVHQKASLNDYLALLKNRSYMLNCAGMTLMTFAIGGISYWMPYYLKQSRGLPEATTDMVFGGIVVLAGLGATLFGGWLGDVLKPKFAGSYFLVCGIGMLVGAPLVLLMLVIPFPMCWVVIFLAVFALFVNTGPGNAILANVTAPGLRASAFALNIFIIHALGDAVSPPIIGWIKDSRGFNSAFVLLCVVMAAGGVLWLLGIRHLEGDTARAETAIERNNPALPVTQ